MPASITELSDSDDDYSAKKLINKSEVITKSKVIKNKSKVIDKSKVIKDKSKVIKDKSKVIDKSRVIDKSKLINMVRTPHKVAPAERMSEERGDGGGERWRRRRGT